MLEYIIKRVLLFIPTLLAITMISFGISRLAPGDPAALKAGANAEGSQSANSGINAKTIEKIRKQWNLDKPVWEQYLIWTKNILVFDFGNSFLDNRPIADKLLERLPVTLSMNIIAIALSYLIAIPIGIYSATHPGSWLDRLSTFGLFALYSMPTFWVGTLALTFITNPEYGMYLFPNSGWRSFFVPDSWSALDKVIDVVWHLALPMLVYTYGSFAFISRQMRSAMLETVRSDYIRTARAKGLNESSVIFKHALRNSLIPILTLLASILPNLVGGSAIVEPLFSIPGIGQLSFQALVSRDYPMIMAIFTLTAILTLAGILIADILYSVFDPRIAFNKKS